MAIRRDKIQIEVEVNGKKAGKSFGDLKKQGRDLTRELNKLTPGTDAFIRKSAELKKVNNQLAAVRKQTRGVADGLDKMKSKGSKIPGIFSKIGPALGAAAIIAGVVAIGKSIFRLGKESLKLFDVQAKVNAQQLAVIKSTNGAAGRSFEQLKKQAQDLQKESLFGDEATQGAQNILLTFKNIKTEVFDSAVPAVLDMATALKVDLKSASILVGKALDDPISGVTALGRSGVRFTADQKGMIKSLVQTGQTAEAQKIILTELESQFKGSAKAAKEAGLGGFQSMGNRLDDLKEQFGELIQKGLKKIQPFLESTLAFFEKFVGAVLSGEKATGRFGGAINFLIGYFKLVIKYYSLLYKGTKFVFVQIAGHMNGMLAVWKQVALNLKFGFESVILSAQIFAKKMDLAFSLKSGTRNRLKKELEELKALKFVAANSGKSVGKAYVEARQKVIDRFKPKDSLKTDPVTGEIDPTSIKVPNSTAPTTTGPGKAKGKTKLQLDLAAAQLSAQKLEAFEAIRFNQGEIREKEHQEALKKIRIDAAKEQLAIYKAAGKEESKEALKLRVKLSELRKSKASKIDPFEAIFGFKPELLKEVIKFREDAISAGLQDEEILLRTKLNAGLIGEQQYNVDLLRIKLSGIEKNLQLLRDTNAVETEEYRILHLAKLGIEKAITDQSDQNKADAEQRRRDLDNELINQTTDVFSSIANLVKDDYVTYKESLTKKYDALVESGSITKEERDKRINQDLQSRRKSIQLFKALEIANIGIKVGAEIQALWQHANENPLNALIPGWGAIYAGVQTGLALGRARSQISKISAQKFSGSGRVQFPAASSGKIYGPSHANEGVRFYTRGGFIGEAEGGEVILNKYHQMLLGGDETFRRIGVPNFMGGGQLPNPNTTPSAASLPSLATDSGANERIDMLLGEMASLMAVLRDKEGNIRAYVVYSDIQDKADELNEITNNANA